MEAPRPTGSRAAMWSIAEIFGAPVIEPPGNAASSSSVRPTSSRSHQFRPADAPVLADAGQVVPLEVDDHHVLGGVLLGLQQPVLRAQRPRPLDRLRPHAAPAPCEKELG
jgi:hypothetical protein